MGIQICKSMKLNINKFKSFRQFLIYVNPLSLDDYCTYITYMPQLYCFS